jgi:hypothetical protein
MVVWDADTPFAAVRQALSRGKRHLIVYVENAGGSDYCEQDATRWVTALVGHQGPRGQHRQALSSGTLPRAAERCSTARAPSWSGEYHYSSRVRDGIFLGEQ